MSTELIIVLLVIAALAVVVGLLIASVSKKATDTDDLVIDQNTPAEHTLTVDEAQAPATETGIVSVPIVPDVSESAACG